MWSSCGILHCSCYFTSSKINAHERNLENPAFLHSLILVSNVQILSWESMNLLEGPYLLKLIFMRSSDSYLSSTSINRARDSPSRVHRSLAKLVLSPLHKDMNRDELKFWKRWRTFTGTRRTKYRCASHQILLFGHRQKMPTSYHMPLSKIIA